LAEQQAREAEAVQKTTNDAELKAKRDAKYAARKARHGKRR